MKTVKFVICFLGIGVSLSCSQQQTIQPTDLEVIGRWNLVRIINGFSQLNQTPEQAGFSETVEYKSDGTYQRITSTKVGQQEEKGKFTIGANPTKTAEKQAILYPDDKTTQPYSFRDGHLFLYQRGSQDATLADGSTYEYQRQ